MSLVDSVDLAIWRLDDTGTHHGHHYQLCTRRRSNRPMVLFDGIKSRIISRTQRNHETTVYRPLDPVFPVDRSLMAWDCVASAPAPAPRLKRAHVHPRKWQLHLWHRPELLAGWLGKQSGQQGGLILGLIGLFSLAAGGLWAIHLSDSIYDRRPVLLFNSSVGVHNQTGPYPPPRPATSLSSAKNMHPSWSALNGIRIKNRIIRSAL